MSTASLQHDRPDQASQKLPVLEKIGFGAGDAAVNVVWSALAIIITFFYTDVYRLRVEHIAMLGLLPRLLDAFADVLMGMYTDSHSTRWGRYRPYLLFLAVPFGIAVMLVFTTPDLSYNGKLIWAYVTYTTMMLVFTGIVIPYISLPGVLTADPKERLSANGYRLFFAKAASLVVNIFVPMFAASYAAKWGEASLPRGYQIAMGAMAVMATLLFIFCFFTTKERVTLKSDRKPMGEQLRLLFGNSQWLILAGVCILSTLGYVLRGSVGLYYAKYFLGGDAALLSAFITVGIVGNILSMVASTWITKYYCKIQLFRWCQMLTFGLSVVMFVVVDPGVDDRLMAFVLYFLINFVVDLQGPVFWSIISEAVDYGQVKSGKRVTGMAFGGISWCQKMGMSLAAGMAGWLLTYYSYVADKAYNPAIREDMFTLNGIALTLTIIPGIFHLATGLLMYGYFITDKYYDLNIKEQLAAMQIGADPAPEAPVP